MAFVKLDTDIIRSTIWFDRPALEVFLTALLLAHPHEVTAPEPQIDVDTLDHTGWCAPPGWYGFVPASGPGLVAAAHVDQEAGIAALRRMGAPEPASRSQEHDGRRLIRINGGYLLLNYVKYRDKDHTTADRSARYRDRKRHAVTASCHAVTSRDVTHAYEDANAECIQDPERIAASATPPKPKKAKRGPLWHFVPEVWKPEGKVLTDTQVLLGKRFFPELAKFREWEFKDGKSDANLAWRRWVRKALEDGEAPRSSSAPRGGPDRADNGWRPDQRHRSLLERLGRPSAELDRMAGEFIRTGAIGALVGEAADKAFAEFIRGKVGAK